MTVLATDLLALTAEYVDIPSVSHHERALTDHIEHQLRAAAPWLTLDRVGDNLVARTRLGRDTRLILAGHTDTVPENQNGRARMDGDTLWGLGSADMKGGLAAMVAVAAAVPDPAVDLTLVFYEAEEVEGKYNGLEKLFRERSDLLDGDVALLGEPTDAGIEAGCQGTMRVKLTFTGARAHTARPWMGRNAIHRLTGALDALSTYVERRPVIDGCEYREALQAVRVEGGIAGNVVPDAASIVINHRFAPDRTVADAEAFLRDYFGPSLDLVGGDTFEVVEAQSGAAPALLHPLLRALIERNNLPVTAKLGWTDVARFSARGIPATNFGPGDATLAHTAEERLERDRLEATYEALVDLVRHGA
ncbi:MAG: succinyl-diaminopimelate desuccinylase [Acidimicrobiia bacterium]